MAIAIRASLSEFGRYFRFFRSYAGRRIYLLMTLILVASYLEGFGIALLLPVFASVSVGGAPSDPISRAIYQVFDVFSISPSLGAVLVFLVLVFVLKGLFMFWAGAYQYRLSSIVTRSIRQRIVESTREIDYRWTVDRNAGVLTNLATQEVTRTGTAFTFYARVFPHLISMVVFFIVLIIMDPRLTLMSIGFGAVMVLFIRAPNLISRRLSKRVTEVNGTVTKLLIQTFQSVKYLLATGRFSALQKKLDGSFHEMADLEYKVGALQSLAQALIQPLVVIFLALVLWQYGSGSTPMGLVLVLLVYLFRLMSEALALQAEWQNFSIYTGALDEVKATLDDMERSRERRGTAPFSRIERAITLQSVSFAYGDKQVLDQVTLEIPRASTVAFVGESGAGKSTLIDILMGVLRPQTGTLRVDDRALDDVSLESYRRSIGYVPQDCLLYDDTIANNISLWAVDADDPAVREQIRTALRQAHLLDWVEAQPGGLTAQIGDRAVRMSGGQKQRLSIARELFRKPELLILDEATSALDSESESLVQSSVEELRGHMTIVIIAHRLATIRKADRIFVLHQGRVVESGTFPELYSKPDSRFRRLCDLQNVVAD
ncbi:MAG: ABC transporter ATP-binding protein [Kofleriaceae bacterium]